MLKQNNAVLWAVVVFVTAYLYYKQNQALLFFDGWLSDGRPIGFEIKKNFSSVEGRYFIDEEDPVFFEGSNQARKIQLRAPNLKGDESVLFEGELKENFVKNNEERKKVILEGTFYEKEKKLSVYAMEYSPKESLLYNGRLLDPFVFYSLIDFSPYLSYEKGNSNLDLSRYRSNSVEDERAKDAFLNQGYFSKALKDQKTRMGYRSKKIKSGVYVVKGYYFHENKEVEFLSVVSYDGKQLKKMFQTPAGYKALGGVEDFSFKDGKLFYSTSLTPQGLLDLIAAQWRGKERLPNCEVCYLGRLESVYDLDKNKSTIKRFRLAKENNKALSATKDDKMHQVYGAFRRLLEGLANGKKEIPWRKVLDLNEGLKNIF